MKSRLIVIAVFVLLAACSNPSEQAASIKYLQTRKADTVDTLFGSAVNDPYRWLENDTSAETSAWVKGQNELTKNFMDKIPYRDALKKRLETLFNYERLSAPFKEGDYYYFYKNDGLQNQSVVYRRKSEQDTPEVFIDPNTFSKDGTTSLAGLSFSKDGSRAAILISKGGADWTEGIIIKTEDRKPVEDTLRNLKFTGISWKGNSGFYYSTYDKPKGSQITAKTDQHKIYYHVLGAPQKNDQVIFGNEIKRRYAGAAVTEDERYLIITATNTTSGNEAYIMDLADPKKKLIPLATDFENRYAPFANEGSRFLVLTNKKASNNRILEVDLKNPTVEKDIIPETEQVIENFTTAGKKILLTYLQDAKSVAKQYDYHGKFEREIKLPGIGTVGGLGGKEMDKEVFYTFTSFTYPPSIYKYVLGTGESTLYLQAKVDFKPEDYETRQVFYKSKDSTSIPMFIVFKKGMEMNGKNPTYLYGYGGFAISLTPSFSTSRIAWLENGGIFAMPNLRGGGEYGEKWHLAGTKLNKQNVFDDFIAAAEYLIREKYTSSSYLAIAGGSNGGLLVGATMAQRPDLMKVAFPAVGVMDMLRYHKFTAGAGWSADYGTADDSKEMFEYLKAYSPVHALKPAANYPATLVYTGDHDDRVVPGHSFKFAARLQEVNQGDNPTLIFVETNSGHGAGKPISKTIEQAADQFAFAWYNMGVVPPLAKKDM